MSQHPKRATPSAVTTRKTPIVGPAVGASCPSLPRATAIRQLADLSADSRNANQGTPRGRRLLRESLEAYGAGRSVLADREGRLIAGNKTVEAAKRLQLPIQVVETDAVDTPTDRKTPAQLRQEEEEFLTEMEREHQARVRQKIDEELTPFRAPWELKPKQAEPGAAADGGGM